MEHNVEKKMELQVSIFKKISLVQNEIETLTREGQTQMNTKFLRLDTILSKVLPVLKKHKLAYSARTCENFISVFIIDCETGYDISCTFKLADYQPTIKGLSNDRATLTDKINPLQYEQVIGKSVTYFMRYGLLQLIGLCADVDTDAEVQTKNTATKLNETLSASVSASSAKTNENLSSVVIQTQITDTAYVNIVSAIEKLKDRFKSLDHQKIDSATLTKFELFFALDQTQIDQAKIARVAEALRKLEEKQK